MECDPDAEGVPTYGNTVLDMKKCNSFIQIGFEGWQVFARGLSAEGMGVGS